MTSLYEELGAEKAVTAAVDVFYGRVLSDPKVKHFFDDIDMEKQMAKQRAFLTMAFGGPKKYSGKDMREAHKHLKLNEEHFQAIAGHLQGTLEELKVPEELIAKAMKIAASTHDDVLNL